MRNAAPRVDSQSREEIRRRRWTEEEETAMMLDRERDRGENERGTETRSL